MLAALDPTLFQAKHEQPPTEPPGPLEMTNAKKEELANLPYKTAGNALLGKGVLKLTWSGKGPDGRHCQIEVACKQIPVVPKNDDSKEAKANLRRWKRREAKLLRRASHAHVVGVIKTHFWPDAADEPRWFCIVMPRAETNLDLCVRQEESAPAVRAEWFGCLAGAVAHLHDLGIWHRDIKPGNILVQAMPGGGYTVLLADFGSSCALWRGTAARERAKDAPAWAGPRPLILPPDKQAGQEVSGTPPYMAPELEAGAMGGLAADVYSLGRVYAEMLAAALNQPARGTELRHPDTKLGRVSIILKKLRDHLHFRNEPERCTPLTAALHDLDVMGTCRKMLRWEPRLRPTADDLREWWQLRRRTDAVLQQCVCPCHPPAAVGCGGDGGGGRGHNSNARGSLRYPNPHGQLGACLKRAYKNGHRLVVASLPKPPAPVMSDDAVLVAAARGGVWEAVEKLAARKLEKVAEKDDEGRTALHYLAGAADLNGDVWRRVAAALLAKGADILARDFARRTPLHIAAETGNPDMVWQLVESVVPARPRGDGTKSSGAMLVKVLCRARNRNAMAKYRREIVAGLLCCGSTDCEIAGADARMYGELNGDASIPVCSLFHDDAMFTASHNGRSGQTPLAIAAMHGHEALVRMLLGRGADANVPDERGRNPLSMAAAYGHEAVASLLLDWHAAMHPETQRALRQAAIDHRDHEGQTALFKAADRGYASLVRLLLEHDADFAIPDITSKETPLLRAAQHGHGAIVRLLLEEVATLPGGIAAHEEEIKQAKGEATRRGHWLVERIILTYTGQDGAPQRQQWLTQQVQEVRAVWDMWDEWWADVVVVMVMRVDKPGLRRDVVWAAAWLVAVGTLCTLLLHLLLPCGTALDGQDPVDLCLLGWNRASLLPAFGRGG